MMGLIIKYLSGDYRAAELSAYRNLFGLIPSALALIWARDWRRSGASFRLRQWRLAVFRGVCVTFAQFFDGDGFAAVLVGGIVGPKDGIVDMEEAAAMSVESSSGALCCE